MIGHGHLLVKNHNSPGRYHHKNSACAVRFTTFGMPAPYTNPRGTK